MTFDLVQDAFHLRMHKFQRFFQKLRGDKPFNRFANPEEGGDGMAIRDRL